MAEITPMLAYAIVILFFLVAIPRDDRSMLGSAGLAIDQMLTALLGTSDMARCPFLRRGMILHQFTKYEYPMEVYACSGNCIVECDGSGMMSADNITVYESTLVTIPLGQEPSCDLDEFLNFVNPEEEGILECDPNSDHCNQRTTASTVCGQGSAQLTVCLRCDNGPCRCEDAYGSMKNCNLDEFMIETFFSPEAKKERVLFSLMGAEMPPWVCYVIFGIFPFMVIYFLVQDILQFTILQASTKRAIALTIGLIGIFSGAFVGITVGLVKFMQFSTSQLTLFLLMGVALLTSFMLIFQTVLQPIAVGAGQATKLKYSIKALKNIYRDMVRRE
jgi:hypothetical protein